MKVLILGATGFIGLPAAQAFSRAGHIVYGVTRSQSNADSLAREEIIPIVADPTDSQGLKALDHIAGLVDVGKSIRCSVLFTTTASGCILCPLVYAKGQNEGSRPRHGRI